MKLIMMVSGSWYTNKFNLTYLASWWRGDRVNNLEIKLDSFIYDNLSVVNLKSQWILNPCY